jgi:hypothetical protein
MRAICHARKVHIQQPFSKNCRLFSTYTRGGFSRPNDNPRFSPNTTKASERSANNFESEHDNYKGGFGSRDNKIQHSSRDKQRFGNIRNLKPQPNQPFPPTTEVYTKPGEASNNKSQCISPPSLLPFSLLLPSISPLPPSFLLHFPFSFVSPSFSSFLLHSIHFSLILFIYPSSPFLLHLSFISFISFISPSSPSSLLHFSLFSFLPTLLHLSYRQ